MPPRTSQILRASLDSINRKSCDVQNFHSLESQLNRRVLSTLSVIGLCFFNVSGGPVGSEQIISTGGPLVGLVGLLIFPLFWCVPVALVTAELSTAFPDDGGYTIWVHQAFGPFWGFQEGYWSWISGVIDNAIYPSLIVSVITQGYGEFGSPLTLYFLKAAMVLAFSVPCIIGVEVVGSFATILSILVLAPFVIMSIWGAAFHEQTDWSTLLDIRNTDDHDGNGIQWTLLINILFWNLNGFDGTSVFAGEVENPNKAYPKALCISIILVVVSYIVPLSVAVAVKDPAWHTWSEGSLSEVAYTIGGDVLVAWVVVSSVLSNFGMFTTELFVDSFQLFGMAEQGLVPAYFAKRDESSSAPRRAIYASAILMLGLVAFDFEVILVANNAICAASIALIMAAAVALRIQEPELHRPFKVPGGIKCLVITFIFPAALTLFIIVTSIESITVVIVILLTLLIGVLLYAVQKHLGYISDDVRIYR